MARLALGLVPVCTAQEATHTCGPAHHHQAPHAHGVWGQGSWDSLRGNRSAPRCAAYVTARRGQEPWGPRHSFISGSVQYPPHSQPLWAPLALIGREPS